MKELLEKIKAFLLKAVAKVKVLPPKVWPFLKKWGLQLVNLLVVGVAYGTLSENFPWAFFIVGLWLFFLLAYYIFWELLGAKNAFKKDEN